MRCKMKAKDATQRFSPARAAAKSGTETRSPKMIRHCRRSRFALLLRLSDALLRDNFLLKFLQALGNDLGLRARRRHHDPRYTDGLERLEVVELRWRYHRGKFDSVRITARIARLAPHQIKKRLQFVRIRD